MVIGKNSFTKSSSFAIFWWMALSSLFLNADTNSVSTSVTLSSSATFAITDDLKLLIVTGADAALFINTLATTYFGPLDGSNSDAASKNILQNLIKALNVFTTDIGANSTKPLSATGQRAYATLTPDNQKKLLLNLKILLYGFNSKLVNDDGTLITATTVVGTDTTNVSLKAKELANLLNNFITRLSAVTQLTDDFAGHKQKLNLALDVYFTTNDPAQIDALVSAGNLLSLTDILGSALDGNGGLLSQIVAQRMQEDSSAFVDAFGNQIKDDGTNVLEDPTQSWQTGNPPLYSLLDAAKTKLRVYWLAQKKPVDKLDSIILALENKLKSPIAVDERIATLIELIDNHSLDIAASIKRTDGIADSAALANDTNFIRLCGMVNRLLASLSPSITAATRRKAYDALNRYQVNNILPSNVLSNYLGALSRTSISEELLPEGTICCLQMINGSTGQPYYLAISDDGTYATTSNSGVMGAARFLVSVYNQDNVVLEWLKDDNISSKNDMTKRTEDDSTYYYYLNVDSSGQLMVMQRKGAKSSSLNPANPSSYGSNFIARSATDRTNFFGDATQTTNPNLTYYFKAYGSQNKLSLQSAANNGFVSVFLDGTFRTISPGDKTPFTLLTDTNGAITQTINTSFTVIKMSETARILASGRRGSNQNFFVIKNNNETVPDINVLTNDVKTSSADSSPHELTLTSVQKVIPTPTADKTRKAAQTIADEIKVISAAMQQAVSEPNGRALVLDEINFFLDAVRNNKATYDALRNQNATSFDTIMSNYSNGFAADLNASSEAGIALAKSYNRALSIWNNIKNNPYRDVLNIPTTAPVQNQTIAFKFNIGDSPKYLAVKPVSSIDGSVSYDLYITQPNPTDPSTHFNVVSSNGTFGFTSAVAKNNYMTVKDPTSYIQTGIKQVSEITFMPLVKDKNGADLPLDAAENHAAQFLLDFASNSAFKIKVQEVNSKDDNGNFFYLGRWNDNTKDAVVIHDQPNNSVSGAGLLTDTDTAKILSCEAVLISAFIKALGVAAAQTDELARIDRYTSLLDAAQTLVDLTAWQNEVTNFLTAKKSSAEDWNKFITDTSKATAMSLLFNKLQSVINVISNSADKATAEKLRNELKDEYAAGFTISLDDYKNNPDGLLSLKWVDVNQTTHYLKVKAITTTTNNVATTTYQIVPTAETIGDPDVQLTFTVNSDKTVSIKFVKADKYLSFDTNGNLTLDAQGKASKFILEGQLNALSFKDSSSKKYLGIRGVGQPMACYSGLTSATTVKPLAGQQFFILEQLSAREIELINIRAFCDLNDKKWKDYAADGNWTAAEDDNLITALSKRINGYATIIAEILSDPAASQSDKAFFVAEINSFVKDLTTLLDGHAWTEMIGNPDASGHFENNVLGMIKSFNDPRLNSQLSLILDMWHTGYTTTVSPFLNGDTIVIGFSADVDLLGSPLSTTTNASGKTNYYLQAKALSYQGATYKMLAPSATFFTKDAQFVVTTFKNKMLLSSVSNPGYYLQVKLASMQDKRFKPLTRATLNQVNIPKGQTFNFLDSALQGYIFEYTSAIDDNPTPNGYSYRLMSNLTDSTSGQNGFLVISKKDQLFAKLDLNATTDETSDDFISGNFMITKLSPFHNKLTEACTAPTVLQALNSFNTILQEDFITNASEAALYTSAIETAFYAYRANSTLWDAFNADSTSAQAMNNFLTLLSNKSSVVNASNITKIKAAVQGQATINVATDYSGVFVSLGWNDPNSIVNTEYFLTRQWAENNTANTIDNAAFTATERFLATTQMQMTQNNTDDNSSFNISFDVQSTDTDKTLFLTLGNQITNVPNTNYVKLTEKSTDALLFKASLSTSGRQIYFTKVDSSSSALTKYLTLYVDADGTKRLALAPGAIINKVSTPNSFQLFNFYKVTDFERQVSLVRTTYGISNQITAYNGIVTQLLNNPVPANLTTFITEFGKFINDCTSNNDVYNSINNNKKNNTAMLSLIAQLAKAAGKDSAILSAVETISDNWNEGFTGAPDANAPTDGSIVIASIVLPETVTADSSTNANNNTLLTISQAPYQDAILYQFQLATNDQSDPMCQLKVHVHKNKFGFESVSKPGYYLMVKDNLASTTDANGNTTITEQHPDLGDPNNRLTFMPLGQNSQGQPIVFGSIESIPFQFTLDVVKDAKGKILVGQYFISSVLDDTITLQSSSTEPSLGRIIIDPDDYYFARTRRLQASTIKQDDTKISFTPVSKLHQKLYTIKNFTADKDILAAYYDLLTNNYVTNTTYVNIFGQSLKNFYSSKTSSFANWQSFAADNDAAKQTTNILNFFGKNPALFKSLNDDITNIVSKGFAQTLNDGDYIYLQWQPTGAAPWLLQPLSGSQSGKILSSVQTSTPSSASVFRVKIVKQNNTNYVQLISPQDDDDYVLVTSKDELDSKRAAATFVKGLDTLKGTDLKRSLFTYQGSSNKMSFQSVSTSGFLSIATTIDTLALTDDNSATQKGSKQRVTTKIQHRTIATLTQAPGTKKPSLSGTLVGKTRVPSPQEIFAATILSKASYTLLSMASPQPGKIGAAISQFLQYPSFYQQQTQTALLNAPDSDKAEFFNAIHNFVTNVVSSKEISSSIVAGVDDRAFASLIDLANTIGPSDNQQKQLSADAVTWEQGYSALVSEMGLPASGNGFILAVSAKSSLSSDTDISPDPTKNNNLSIVYSVEPQIIYPILSQFDGIYRLGTTNFNNLLQGFANSGFSGDEMFEKFILFNDPFDSKALLKSAISRNSFGMQTDLTSEATNMFLIIDPTISFGNGKLDLNAWQKAVVYFGQADFNQEGNNPAHFSVKQDADKQTFLIASDANNNNLLSVDPNDGYIRTFQLNTSMVKPATKSNATNYEKFIIVPTGDFYNSIATARAAWTASDKQSDIISNYQKAIYAVKSQQELDWMAEELIRYVVAQKVDQPTWTNFLANTDFIKNYRQLIKTFVSTFIKLNGKKTAALVSNLRVKQLHYSLLIRQDNCLNGILAPKFLKNILVENAIPDFDTAFQNLETRLNDLTSGGVTTFLADIQKLINRKTELVLDNNITSTNFGGVQQDLNANNAQNAADLGNTTKDAFDEINAVADWLELVCSSNANLIDNKQELLDMAAKLRATYNYTQTYLTPNFVIVPITTFYNFNDIIANVNDMAQNIPGFSSDRANLFVTQAAKLAHPLSLSMAMNDAIPLEDARKAIRMVMSNQMAVICKTALDLNAVEIPMWLTPKGQAISGTGAGGAITYGDFLNQVLKLLNYPLTSVKGQSYIDLVTKAAANLESMSTSDNTQLVSNINQLYDIISAWDGSIGSKLQRADVLSMTTFASVNDANFTDATFLSLKQQLATTFIGLVKGAVAYASSVNADKNIINKYNQIISSVASYTGLTASKIAAKNVSLLANTTPGSQASTTSPTSALTSSTSGTQGEVVLSFANRGATTTTTQQATTTSTTNITGPKVLNIAGKTTNTTMTAE